MIPPNIVMLETFSNIPVVMLETFSNIPVVMLETLHILAVGQKDKGLVESNSLFTGPSH
jgi:hypothetical protein